MRTLLGLASFLALTGCTRPDLPDSIVRAGSTEELSGFRAELGTRFPAGQLATFDTALQEIRLEALNQDIAPAAAREDYLRGAVNGLTVQAVRIRGWQARRHRFQAEIDLLSRMEQDLVDQQETKGATASNSSRLAAAREVLGRLQRDLVATQTQLEAWGAK